jgi:hypothetical protein
VTLLPLSCVIAASFLAGAVVGAVAVLLLLWVCSAAIEVAGR